VRHGGAFLLIDPGGSNIEIVGDRRSGLHRVGRGAAFRGVGGCQRGQRCNALAYEGNLDTLADVGREPNYSFVQSDICDRERMGEVFARHRPDLVMHLAAESHVDRSIASLGDFIRTNVVGTHTPLDEQLERLALPLKKRAYGTFLQFLIESGDSELS